MNTKLKAGVIGLGSMGKHHARVWAKIEDAELVAVCDTNIDNLQYITGRPVIDAARQYKDCTVMLRNEDLDAVSICVPTEVHLPVAKEAMRYGCHVLLEKPIAQNLRQATAIKWIAEEKGLILAIGHLERYNPAFIEAWKLIHSRELGEIRAIQARRVGPNPERIRDVGVVIDLAVHDIDLMRWILGKEPTVLAANLTHVNHGPDREDGADALLSFEGIPGFLTTNWLTSAKIRDLTIICDKGTIIADLFRKRVGLWRRYNDCEEFIPYGREPLEAEILNFIKAIRGEIAEIISAEDGTRALKTALEILRKGAERE